MTHNLGNIMTLDVSEPQLFAFYLIFYIIYELKEEG